MADSNNSLRLEKSPFRRIVGKVINHAFSLYEMYFPEQLNIEEKVWVNDVPVGLKNLPPEFDGYRIAHVSDIHLGTWVKPFMMERIAALINSLNPHMVIIGGDLISSATVNYLPYYEEFLQQLHTADGVVVVRGNHDCYVEKDLFRRVIQQGGAHFLDNRLIEITRGQQKITITGLDCSYYNQDNFSSLLPKLHYKNANVLVVHEPDKADQYSRSGKVSLQLAGHSHGGQILLPLIGSPWLPRVGRKYPSGLYRLNGMLLYTNRGIGTSSAHLRIGCPPEVALVRLHVQEQGAG